MTCAACVARVERALRRVPGVSRVTVSLTGETAFVTLAGEGVDVEPLIQAVHDAGYEAASVAATVAEDPHASAVRRAGQWQETRRAIFASIAFGLPIMALHLLGRAAGPAHHGILWTELLQLVLATAMMLSPAATPILTGGFRAVRHRAPNMDLLIAMGVTAAMAGSVIRLAATLMSPDAADSGHSYFDTAAMILLFVNIGRGIEARVRGHAASSIEALALRTPRTARRVRDHEVTEVAVDDLCVGDHVRISAEEYVPVDGTVLEGAAAVDQALLTGESVPVDVEPGSPVYGGTRVTAGSILVAVAAIGAESAIARIRRHVEEALTSRTRLQRVADRAAAVFVPVVVLLAMITLAGWLSAGLLGGYRPPGWWSDAFTSAIAVLVVACPCAMGLATPTAVMVATGNAALRGILVRDAAALEMTGMADTVLLDKTGTLTTGHPTVTQVVGQIGECDAREVLRLAASAEQFSRHPLAGAIVAKAREWGLELSEPESYQQETGLGVTILLEGSRVLVGNPAFIEKSGIQHADASERTERLTRDGQTVVLVARNRQVIGIIALADRPRPTAAQTIAQLRRLGVEPIMVTGDNRHTAAAIAAEVGLRQVRAELTPEGKLAVVRELQAADRRVIFAGDGINDAPALAAADAGIAFATGTEIAIEAAGITLAGDDLRRVAEAVQIARRSVRIIRQNLFWALAYNLATIPLAALGILPASLAAATMMFSSISVVMNSLRLRTGEEGVNR